MTLDNRLAFAYTECNEINKGVAFAVNEVQPIKNKRDIERIKKALANNPRNLLLFIIGINTALRISDILTLRIRDISDTHLTITEKKTGKRRRFIINEAIRSAFRDLMPNDASPNDWLFPSLKGRPSGASKPLGRVQAWRILIKAAEDVGVKIPIGTHSLRKTFAYHAYNSGVALPLLMRILIHSSQRETLRYIGIESEQIDDVFVDVCL